MVPRSIRRLAAAAVVVAGCSFDAADFRGTTYLCGPDHSCPDGFTCTDGVCATGDAGAPATDAPTADAAPRCPGNLVSNPSFENGTSGWGGVGGPITQVNQGHDGEHAAEKCYDGSDTYYNVSDQPDSVTDTAVGSTYALAAWVRSSARQTLHAVIRAKDSMNNSLEQTSTTIVLSDDWQEVTAEHTVDDPAAAVVEVYFSVPNPGPVGECFQLDDICFVPAP